MKNLITILIAWVRSHFSYPINRDLDRVFDEYSKVRSLIGSLTDSDEAHVTTVYSYANEFRLELLALIPISLNHNERHHLNAMLCDVSEWLNSMVFKYRCCVSSLDEEEVRRLNSYIRKKLQ